MYCVIYKTYLIVVMYIFSIVGTPKPFTVLNKHKTKLTKTLLLLPLLLVSRIMALIKRILVVIKPKAVTSWWTLQGSSVF